MAARHCRRNIREENGFILLYHMRYQAHCSSPTLFYILRIYARNTNQRPSHNCKRNSQQLASHCCILSTSNNLSAPQGFHLCCSCTISSCPRPLCHTLQNKQASKQATVSFSYSHSDHHVGHCHAPFLFHHHTLGTRCSRRGDTIGSLFPPSTRAYQQAGSRRAFAQFGAPGTHGTPVAPAVFSHVGHDDVCSALSSPVQAKGAI